MASRVHKLAETFAVLKPDQSVAIVDVTPRIYADLVRNFDNFAAHSLVSLHEFSGPWPTWEKHPAGDEVIVLLSGVATLRIRTASGEETVTLDTAGSYTVVPRNTWHTAETSQKTRMLFITPGEGTEQSDTIEDAT